MDIWPIDLLLPQQYGGFQLQDLIITELKSYMICYDAMSLVGWNYSNEIFSLKNYVGVFSH